MVEGGLHKLKRWSSRTPYSAAQCLADKAFPLQSIADADMESTKSSDASLHEVESPTSQTGSPTDTPKETESPRFQALLRMTGGPRKKNDIKSYSHELDPRGVRPLDFLKTHSDNDLEKILEALRAKFNSAKEEVNSELEVFAGDLVEILEKNANQPAEWQEKAEDLLVLARQCALMSSTDFRKHCESIVQDLDDKRQILPMGILKQLHTRMLFILTRCTRLLQFQKVNGLEESLPTHKSQQLNKTGPPLDRAWTMAKKNIHQKGKGIVVDLSPVKDQLKLKTPTPSPPLPVPEGRKGGDRRRDEGTSSRSAKIERIKPSLAGGRSSTLRKEKVITEVDSLVADRLASWRKFKASSESSRSSTPTPSTPDSAHSEGRSRSHSKSKRDLQVHVDRDNGPSVLLRKDSGQNNTPSIQHRLSWGYWGDQPGQVEDSSMVICRICDEEVPTVVLEEHLRVCAFADRCDHKALGIDDRLKRLAETLEMMLETFTPKNSQLGAGGSPDAMRASNLFAGEGSLVSMLDRSSSLNRRNSEDMLEDLHEIDTASIDDLKGVFNSKSRFGPKSDQNGLTSSSGGSLTPRSPMTTSRTSSLDPIFIPDRNSLLEPGDPMQMSELADIARCVANCNPGDQGVEYIVSCMQDLAEVLQHNKVEALTVDTFGKRIDKILREKYQLVAEAAEQNSVDIMLDDDGSTEDDGFPSSKSTPLHPSAYKDRTSIDDFEIIKPISRGAFGRVFLARKKITGDLFAIKVLRKVDMIRKNAVESVQAERNILISARNPFVVRFFYSFTCKVNLYLVMEYLNGGDLYSMLRTLGCLEEDMARVYIAELVLALEYLHSLGVVHRDLKPDNLLIAHDGHIKLTDFGLSRVGLINSTDDLSGPAAKGTMQVEESWSATEEYSKQQRERRQQQSAVGTPDYLAPEILLGTGHGATADWWSTGVILFEFLTGIPPFNAEHPQIIFDNILNRNIPWPAVPADMSYEAQDLVNKLLREDPSERLGAKGAFEVKAHPFFKDINWDTLARQKAAFVPSPDTAHDTSYFTSRHMWNQADSRVFPEEDFGDSSDYESSSNGGSSGSSRPEDGGDEYCEMTEFESTPAGKYTFSNFSFKNLSQLASINYDLLIQTGGKDTPKGKG